MESLQLIDDSIAAWRIRWIKALLSGEYQQAHGALHRQDGFCCMGVACDLVDPDGWAEDASHFRFQNLSIMFPTKEVARKFGMRAGATGYLAFLNDEAKLGFQQIADILRFEWNSEYYKFRWEWAPVSEVTAAIPEDLA